MLIKITDPVTQTYFFEAIFLLLLVFSARKHQDDHFFSKEVTEQLKGFSILAIVFSHIGYFLSSDTRFLYPFSVLAGVGVNLFLFLSGFGLTLSSLKNPLSIFSFYKKRLIKLFIPLWIILVAFLLLDFFLLYRTYPISEIIHNILGFFPRADLFKNIDSPLWYFSVILFYYLVFPLTFIKHAPLLSPLLILIVSLIVLRLPLPVDPGVLNLYKLHFLAFPIGMAFGMIIRNFEFKPNIVLKLLILAISVPILLYTSINSYVGGDSKLEQSISLITAFTLILIFTLIPIRFKLLSIVGIFSYEVYLIHWPIVSRFNPFLSLPPVLWVLANLILFIALGYILQKVTAKISTFFH